MVFCEKSGASKFDTFSNPEHEKDKREKKGTVMRGGIRGIQYVNHWGNGKDNEYLGEIEWCFKVLN